MKPEQWEAVGSEVSFNVLNLPHKVKDSVKDLTVEFQKEDHLFQADSMLKAQSVEKKKFFQNATS